MGFSRPCLTALTWLVAIGFVSAQNGEERHADLIPARPTTKAELDHREVLGLYAIAALKEQNNCLLEAAHLYEEALRLEPNAVPILRSLASLYFALDRIEDGCQACEKILAVDSNDFGTGLQYAPPSSHPGSAARCSATTRKNGRVAKGQGATRPARPNPFRLGVVERNPRRVRQGRSRAARLGEHPRRSRTARRTRALFTRRDPRPGCGHLRATRPFVSEIESADSSDRRFRNGK